MKRIAGMGDTPRVRPSSGEPAPDPRGPRPGPEVRGGGGTAEVSAAGRIALTEARVQSHARRDEVVEELRAEQQRRGERTARAAAQPAPEPPPLDAERLNRSRTGATRLVKTLTLHEPPAEGRVLASLEARVLRETREDQVGDIVSRARNRRSVLQERARAAYREAAGLSSDARLS